MLFLEFRSDRFEVKLSDQNGDKYDRGACVFPRKHTLVENYRRGYRTYHGFKAEYDGGDRWLGVFLPYDLKGKGYSA